MIATGGRRHGLRGAGTVVAVYIAVSVLLVGAGVLMTHVLAYGAIGHWDDDVVSWSAHHRSAGWNRLDADVTHLANTTGIVLAACLVTAVVLAVRRSRWALLPGLGLLIEISGFLTANYAVGRPRPHVPHVGSTPSTFSWPSGHVAATVVLYGGIALLVTMATRALPARILVWLLAAVVVVAVGAARVYAGEHHPTDVLAGLVLGVAALSGAAHALRPRGPA